MLPSLQGRFKGLSSRRMWSRRPCGPDHIAAFKTAYIHRSQADPTSHNRRPPLTPEYPYPRICIGDLRECHASTQAHNDAHVQLVVVDLEEPRSLRATITWPGSEAMQHPAYQLPRIPLPKTVWKIGSGKMMTYAPEHEKELFHRSYRRRMAVSPVLPPSSEA